MAPSLAVENGRFFNLLKAPSPPEEIVDYVFAAFVQSLMIDRRRLGLCFAAQTACCERSAEQILATATTSVLRHCRARHLEAFRGILHDAGLGGYLATTAKSDATRCYLDWTNRRFATAGTSVFDVGAAILGLEAFYAIRDAFITTHLLSRRSGTVVPGGRACDVLRSTIGESASRPWLSTTDDVKGATPPTSSRL
jgi:hypothetical protein